MGAGALLTICAAAAATMLGGLRTVPLEPDTTVFLADTNGNAVADICLLTGHTLVVHDGADPSAEPFALELGHAATAFDIADLDGDGVPELIAVEDHALVRYSLRPGRQPTVLFERPSSLAQTAAEPYPFVLVVEKNDTPVIALPGSETFDLLTASGEVVRSFPLGEDAPQRVEFGQPFRTWTTTQPQLGPAHGLEGFASHIVGFEPDLPPDLVPIAREGQLYEGPRVPRPDPGGSGQTWPAFRIGRHDSHELRARFALAGGERAETLIRVERRQLDADGRPVRMAEEPGPERRYPGTVLLSAMPPDFDGDGFADLLLWDAPLPGRSVGALSEALTSAEWPIRVRMHRFDSAARRFEARSSGAISFGIPVEWFLFPGEIGPIRLHTVADFDGDGRSDFGCQTGPRTFTIWHSSRGYSEQSARRLHTREPIESVAFANPLGERRAATMALRTESTLYILDPR